MTEKVAIVTAGGSGMGAGAARKLAADGFQVAILSSSGKGEALAKELGGIGVTGSNQSNEIPKAINRSNRGKVGAGRCAGKQRGTRAASADTGGFRRRLAPGHGSLLSERGPPDPPGDSHHASAARWRDNQHLHLRGCSSRTPCSQLQVYSAPDLPPLRSCFPTSTPKRTSA